MMKPTCAGLPMVTFLSWKFLHRTDPGREQERINVTFRWIKRHVLSYPLLRAGVACCSPACAQGSSVLVTDSVGNGVLGAFGLLFGALCVWRERRVLALLVYTLLCTGLGSHRCASYWTRPLDGGWWEHYLCDLWGECLAAHKTAKYLYGIKGSFMRRNPYMLALAGQPSLQGYHACTVYWNEGALRRNCRQKYGETSFSPSRVFSVKSEF